MSGTNIGYVSGPFLIWMFSDKVSIQKIGVAMQSLTMPHISFSPYNRQQIILVHNSKNSFGVAMNPVSLQPYMYSSVAISVVAALLTFPDFLG